MKMEISNEFKDQLIPRLLNLLLILIFIALPSLKILYIIDELNNPILTIKAIGHQ